MNKYAQPAQDKDDDSADSKLSLENGILVSNLPTSN